MSSNVLLAVFLAFSLATQMPGFGAQMTKQNAATGLSQPAVAGHTPYNTDFDDDQRDSHAFVLAFVNLLNSSRPLEQPFQVSARLVDFCFAGLPLFKLHAALLI
jgi:hypothetical protein